MPSLHKSAFRLMKKEIETIIHVSAWPKGFGRTTSGSAPQDAYAGADKEA